MSRLLLRLLKRVLDVVAAEHGHDLVEELLRDDDKILASLDNVIHGEVVPLMVFRILENGRAKRDLLDEYLAVLRDLERDERAADVKGGGTRGGVEDQSPYYAFLFLGRRWGRLRREPLYAQHRQKRSKHMAYSMERNSHDGRREPQPCPKEPQPPSRQEEHATCVSVVRWRPT